MKSRQSSTRPDCERSGLFAAQAKLEMDQLKVYHDVVDGSSAITRLPLGDDGPVITLPVLTVKRKSDEAWTGQQSSSMMLPKEEDLGTLEKVSEYLSRQRITDYPGEISRTIAYCENNEGKEVCHLDSGAEPQWLEPYLLRMM